MPYSENEKLQRFADEVLGTAESERQRIVSETNSKYEHLILEGKQKIRDDSLDYLAKEISAIRQKSSQILSKHTMEKRKELLLYRENIIKTISDKVLARLHTFIASPEYKTFLTNICLKVLKSQEDAFVLYLSEADMQYKNDLISAITDHPELSGKVIDILSEKSICLGGIRFLSGSGRILINETLDQSFIRQQDELVKLIEPVSGTIGE